MCRWGCSYAREEWITMMDLLLGLAVMFGVLVVVVVICFIGFSINMSQFLRGTARLQGEAYAGVFPSEEALRADPRSTARRHAFRTLLLMTVVYTIHREEEQYRYHFSVKSRLGAKSATRYGMMLIAAHVQLFEKAGIEKHGQFMDIGMPETGTFHVTFLLDENEHEALRQQSEKTWSEVLNPPAQKPADAKSEPEPAETAAGK
jgi:hypothetical protein